MLGIKTSKNLKGEKYNYSIEKKNNYKQGENTAFRMGENNSKWSNWQTTNLKNIQATPKLNSSKINYPI